MKPSAYDQLCAAVQGGSLQEVQRILEMGVTRPARLPRGNSALHVAAWEGHEEIVSLLLRSGEPIDAVNPQGKSALHLAAQKLNVGVARLLLANGARHDLADATPNGNFPLHLAARASGIMNVDRFEQAARTCQVLLSSGASPSVLNKQSQTPADLAGISCNDELSMALREAMYAESAKNLADKILKDISHASRP